MRNEDVNFTLSNKLKDRRIHGIRARDPRPGAEDFGNSTLVRLAPIKAPSATPAAAAVGESASGTYENAGICRQANKRLNMRRSQVAPSGRLSANLYSGLIAWWNRAWGGQHARSPVWFGGGGNRQLGAGRMRFRWSFAGRRHASTGGHCPATEASSQCFSSGALYGAPGCRNLAASSGGGECSTIQPG